MSKPTKTGWTGWVTFAAIIAGIGGAFDVLGGLMAIFNNEVAVFSLDNVWVFDLTTWGWINLIAGGLAILAAISLLKGHFYGRLYVIIASVIGAVVNIARLPIYPFWSLLAIIVYGFVLYAVVIHGGEMED